MFLADPGVGGRFSAFTEFGLVPAALIGVDVSRLLERGRDEAERHRPSSRIEEAPGLRLGAALGEIGLRRDKLTILTSPRLRSFPDWLEQLIAESLGKDGRGVLPIAGEAAVPAADYGDDRVFAALLLDGDDNAEIEKRLGALEKRGFPVIRIRLADVYDLGREIFRWEIATAAAGAVLGVHPFNQPDVELAKDLARKAMAGAAASGARRRRTTGSSPPAKRPGLCPISWPKPDPAITSLSRPISIRMKRQQKAWKSCAGRSSKRRAGRRRSASGPASSIPPASITKAAPTRDCSSSSWTSPPRTCRCRRRISRSASSSGPRPTATPKPCAPQAAASCGSIWDATSPISWIHSAVENRPASGYNKRPFAFIADRHHPRTAP